MHYNELALAETLLAEGCVPFYFLDLAHPCHVVHMTSGGAVLDVVE